MIRCLIRSPVLSIAFLLTLGCGKRDPPRSSSVVRDSAGVEIIESVEPLLPPGSWTVSSEPVLQIGEVEGDERYLFSRIASGPRAAMGRVFRLRDGRIVVADGADQTVRFFDSQGNYLSQFGREGEGPGEFEAPISYCFWDGEHFVVGEYRRISFFDAEGRYLDRFDPRTRGEVFGLFADGAVLVLGRIVDPKIALDPPAGVYTGMGTVSIVNADGSPSEWVDTVAERRTVAIRVGEYPSSIELPFGPRLVLLTAGETFIYGWGEDYELRVSDRDGNLRRIIRRLGNPSPVTEDDKESFRRSILGRDRGGAEAQATLSGLIFPDHKSAFNRVLLDGIGHLWVHRPYQADTWDVFDPSGRWVTTMTLPEGVQIHDIGEDYILGVWIDELGVQFVRMHTLDRG